MQRFHCFAAIMLQYAAKNAFLGWAHEHIGFIMQKYPRIPKITLSSKIAAAFFYFPSLSGDTTTSPSKWTGTTICITDSDSYLMEHL